jgi:hypothetical protein
VGGGADICIVLDRKWSGLSSCELPPTKVGLLIDYHVIPKMDNEFLIIFAVILDYTITTAT